MVERIRTLLESRQLSPTQFADVIGVARPIISHILSGRNKPSLEVVQRILAAMPDLAMPWLLNGAGPMVSSPAISGEPSVAAAPQTTAVATAPTPEHRYKVTNAAGAQLAPALAITPAPIPQEQVSAALPTVAPLRASVAALNRATTNRFVTNGLRVNAAPPPAGISQSLPQPIPVAADQPPVVAPVPDAAPGPATPAPPPAVELPVAGSQSQPVPADELPGAAWASALFAGGDKPIRRIVIFYRDGSFADYQPE